MIRILTSASALLLLIFAIFSCTDTSELENKIENIENRVTTLEKLTAQMNTNISALQSAVTALQSKDYVTNVTEIKEGVKVIGYKISFDKSGAVTIYHGQDGIDGTNGVNGKDGNTPVIGVKLFSDGMYYWTLNGNWLTDAYGYKIKAQGIDGHNGADGKDGITPKIKIENEHWMLSVDNGLSWSDLGKAKGEDGDSFFQSVTQDAHNVYIVLIDGTEITIPKKEALSIMFDSSDLINISAGETKSISYAITSSAESVRIETYEQAGWTVKLNKTTDKSGTMSITAPIPISDGKIMVVLTDNYDNCYIKTITMTGVGSYITTVNDSYTAQSLGGQFAINVNTNTEYTVLIPEEAQSWLKVDSKGPILVLSLSTNTAYDDRSTKVTLVGIDGVTTSEFVLTQFQKDAIVLSESNYNLTYNAQDVEIVLQSNVDVMVEIPADITWISHSSTRALTERVVTLNVALNEDAPSRTGNITITDPKRNITKSITVTQNGAKAEISVSSGVATVILPRAGELNETFTTNGINTSLISTLHISGLMNGTDIATIRSMSALKNLDIKNVSIVSGGDAYYDVNHTVNNVVGKYMFSSLTNLQSIVLPTNITDIEAFAFDNCTSLTNIDIPNSVLNIGVKAFFGCSNLTAIELPINLSTISSQTFGDCTGLTKVVINAKVTSIDDYAFSNCNNLTEINIPDKVTRIGSYAFSNCGNIAKLTLSGNVTSIGLYAFTGCGGDITINCSIPNATSNNQGKFYGALFRSVTFGYSVTSVGSYAFENCNKIENINFPSSITSIGNYAFLNCSGVKSIVIPSSIRFIGSNAFSGCTGTAIINCDVSAYAFFNSKITEASIEGNATVIGNLAFAYCRNLTKVTIGNSVLNIGSEVFYDTSSLSLYCKSSVPPHTNYNSFSRAEILKIYVPTAALDAYRNSWGSYVTASNIVGYIF